MTQIFNRVGTHSTTAIYFNELTGEKIILVRKKLQDYRPGKPAYYLKKGSTGQKPVFVSGLFPTPDPTVFTGDTIDSITGMKAMFTVQFDEHGKSLLIGGLL